LRVLSELPEGDSLLLLYLPLDTKGESTITAIAVDSYVLEEGTRASCGVEGNDDTTFLPGSDRLLTILWCRASTGGSHTSYHEGRIPDVLDDEGMRDLSICLLDHSEVELRSRRTDDCTLTILCDDEAYTQQECTQYPS